MFRDYMKQLFESDNSDYEKLTSKVKEEIDFYLNMQKHNYISVMNKCESPIEQLLVLNLVETAKHIEDSLFVFGPDAFAGLQLQKEISVDETTYRVDFLLTVSAEGNERKYVIECDGHDFHERTKQQAARDRKRDRLLMKYGYKVIRFTGSEIWKSPYDCVKQVNEIVDSDFGIDDAWAKRMAQDME